LSRCGADGFPSNQSLSVKRNGSRKNYEKQLQIFSICRSASVSQANLEQSLFPEKNEEPHAQILLVRIHFELGIDYLLVSAAAIVDAVLFIRIAFE
jgi:hypothetical protein